MRWLAENTVYLSCADEISADYVKYKATESQFSVPNPYQTTATPPGQGLDQKASVSHRSSPGIHEEDDPVPPTEKLQSAGTKRKRSILTKGTQRAAREHEAQQRHLEVHEHLLRAHKMCLAFHGQQEELSDSSRGLTTSKEFEGSLPLAAVHGKLDLIALSHMKKAVRPKLTFAAGDVNTEHSNLFDQLISNDSDHEHLADAAGSTVLLPPRSRFMISDIARLKPLLAGQHCLESHVRLHYVSLTLLTSD